MDPTPPAVQEISLSCPSDITQTDLMVTSQTIAYDPPKVTGGAPPVTVTCSPASGTAFPLGTTTVTCEATDGTRRATCPFKVELDPRPLLRATRFMAFGDSLTNGEVQLNPFRTAVERDKSYPTVLAQMLTGRYTTQSITMFNEGASGESSETGAARIGRALSSDNPDVLLLLQGILDLGNGPSYIDRITITLRSDINMARNRGVREIFLSTLLPQKEPLPGFPANNHAMPYIAQANDAIRALAAQENVYLVDSFVALTVDTAGNIGGDGLHPTPQGYVALAQAFFDSIKMNLEQFPVPNPAAKGILARPSPRR
jgi:lysophospholipase L1-like esterase